MSKRKQRQESGASWLQDSQESGSLSLQDVTAAGYGLDLNTPTRIIAKPIKINQIRPNIEQPRRTIPSAVRDQWQDFSNGYDAVQLLNWWFDAAAEMDIEGLLNGDEEAARPEEPDAISLGLLRIIDLAASIRREGLTNPITVVAAHDGFIIETGERRWLSFHLLNMALSDDAWETIPAQVVETYDVWRQATENSARDDLNAIAKARQLAILLMDLYREENTDFQPINSFAHEQDYYAQVADGNEWRVPRGEGQRLLQALGLSDPAQIRQYRGLLRVPQDFWTYADDNNLTEREIRDAAKHGYTVTPVTVAESTSDKSTPNRNSFEYFADRTFPNMVKQISRMAKQDRAKTIDYIRRLLDELESNA